MVDIQSPITEIRRGKKIEERKMETIGQKYNGLPYSIVATITSIQKREAVTLSQFCCGF